MFRLHFLCLFSIINVILTFQFQSWSCSRSNSFQTVSIANSLHLCSKDDRDISNPQQTKQREASAIDPILQSIRERSGEDNELEVDETQTIPDEIMKYVENNRPSNWEVTRDIMGITPWTIAGFALSALLLTANSIFGNGWLGDLLSLDTSIISNNQQNELSPEAKQYFQDLFNTDDVDEEIRKTVDKIKQQNPNLDMNNM